MILKKVHSEAVNNYTVILCFTIEIPLQIFKEYFNKS